MPNVNPEILRWARETAGLSLEEAAEKLSIPEARGVPGGERLSAIEEGRTAPTRPLLLKMVKQYRRPLLAFYMGSIPREAARVQDFRTLSPEHSRTEKALVDALIRDVRARQEIARAILEEEDEAEPLPFVGSKTMAAGVDAVVQAIRETLHLSLERYRARSPRDGLSGFKYLRRQAEQAGIFVLLMGNLGSHRTNLDVETFRGFALSDPVAPFIVINDQDNERARAFTLLHELCHIWLGQTGVSGTSAANTVEQFCNDVAARFFLPSGEIGTLGHLRGATVDAIRIAVDRFADERCISHSMVAYNLFREQIITRDAWQELSRFYRRQWKAAREADREKNKDGDGPSYYVVRRYRVGEALLNLARRMLAGQALSPSRAAKLLGVKPSNVYPMITPDTRATGGLRSA